MANHELVDHEDGNLYLNDMPLLKRYPEGDYDFVAKDDINGIVSVLYDEYQIDDTIKEGDTFSIDGKVIARCESVHVVKVD